MAAGKCKEMMRTAEEQNQAGLTRVWLLRHGESADPTVFHGAESDIGLSERGRRQADALVPLIAGFRPAVIVSSAMRRAIDTATPSANACDLPLRVEPDLHERKVGPMCGTPFSWSEGVWAETYHRWMAGATAYAPEGTESFDAIRDRVLPVWRRLTDEYAGQSLVIVAHGVICKVLLATIGAGFGPADWQKIGSIRNAAIHELHGHGNTWRVIRLNDLPEQFP